MNLQTSLPTQQRQHGWGRACMLIQSCPTLCDPIAVAHQAPLSMGFPRQEYWSQLPFPSPGNIPDPGIEPTSPELQADSLPLSHQGSWMEAEGTQI